MSFFVYVRLLNLISILSFLDNGSELTVYDCHDKYIDKKLGAKAVIKNKTVCYEDFCNAEKDCKIPREKSFDNQSYISEFWIYIGVIILLTLIIHILKIFCACKADSNSETFMLEPHSRTRLLNNYT